MVANGDKMPGSAQGNFSLGNDVADFYFLPLDGFVKPKEALVLVAHYIDLVPIEAGARKQRCAKAVIVSYVVFF